MEKDGLKNIHLGLMTTMRTEAVMALVQSNNSAKPATGQGRLKGKGNRGMTVILWLNTVSEIDKSNPTAIAWTWLSLVWAVGFDVAIIYWLIK